MEDYFLWDVLVCVWEFCLMISKLCSLVAVCCSTCFCITVVIWLPLNINLFSTSGVLLVGEIIPRLAFRRLVWFYPLVFNFELFVSCMDLATIRLSSFFILLFSILLNSWFKLPTYLALVLPYLRTCDPPRLLTRLWLPLCDYVVPLLILYDS